MFHLRGATPLNSLLRSHSDRRVRFSFQPLVLDFIQQPIGSRWSRSAVSRRRDGRIAQTGNSISCYGRSSTPFCGVDHQGNSPPPSGYGRYLSRSLRARVPAGSPATVMILTTVPTGGGDRDTTLFFHLHPVRFLHAAGAIAFTVPAV